MTEISCWKKVGRSATRRFLCYWRFCLLTTITHYMILITCKYKLAKITFMEIAIQFVGKYRSYLNGSITDKISSLICLLRVIRYWINFVGAYIVQSYYLNRWRLFASDPLQTSMRFRKVHLKCFLQYVARCVKCVDSSKTRHSCTKPGSCINHNIIVSLRTTFVTGLEFVVFIQLLSLSIKVLPNANVPIW